MLPILEEGSSKFGILSGMQMPAPAVRNVEVDTTLQSNFEFSFHATELDLPERPISVMSVPDAPRGCPADIPPRPDTTDIGDTYHPHTGEHTAAFPLMDDSLSRLATPAVATAEAPLRAEPSGAGDPTPHDAMEIVTELSVAALVTARQQSPAGSDHEEPPASPCSLDEPQSDAGDPQPAATTVQEPTQLVGQSMSSPAVDEPPSAVPDETLRAVSSLTALTPPDLTCCDKGADETLRAVSSLTALTPPDCSRSEAAELERSARAARRASITSWNVPSRRGMCRTIPERAPLSMKGPQRVSSSAGPPLIKGVPVASATGRTHNNGKLHAAREAPFRVSTGEREPNLSNPLDGVLSVASKLSTPKRELEPPRAGLR
jgi:hypothetical protein